MKPLDGFPGIRADRPASAVLHDEASVRVVAFALAGNQVIGEHRSSSTVLVHVVSGAGRFRGEADEHDLVAGQSGVFAPDEMHAITAGPEGLHFLAMISPGPTAAVRSSGPRGAEPSSS